MSSAGDRDSGVLVPPPRGRASARAPVPGGFTLLEVLVVIALMGLLAGLAFPRVDRMIDTAQFASARSSLSAAAVAARGEAMRTDTIVTLDSSPDRRSLLSNGRPVAVLPGSVRLQSSRPAPRFFGDGSGTGGRLLLVAGSSRAELRIRPGTGLVEWRR